MSKIYFVGWLGSLAVAFHFGWLARHKLVQKVKEEHDKAIASADGVVSPLMLSEISQSFWNML